MQQQPPPEEEHSGGVQGAQMGVAVLLGLMVVLPESGSIEKVLQLPM